MHHREVEPRSRSSHFLYFLDAMRSTGFFGGSGDGGAFVNAETGARFEREKWAIRWECSIFIGQYNWVHSAILINF